MYDRILVVDAGLATLAPHLAVLGVAAEFTHPTDAIARLRAGSPRCLVVLDVTHPNVIALATALRKARAPVIVVTDYPELVPMVTLLGVDVADVLPRSAHAADVAAAIARELEGVRAVA